MRLLPPNIPQRDPRRGITLVEVLILLTLLALVLLLGFNAWLLSCRASWLTTTKNHFRRLGVATHNYHSTYNSFPTEGGRPKPQPTPAP